jgi:hypothetical protein
MSNVWAQSSFHQKAGCATITLSEVKNEGSDEVLRQSRSTNNDDSIGSCDDCTQQTLI